MSPDDRDNQTQPPAEPGVTDRPMVRRFKGDPTGRPKGSKNRKTVVKQVAGEMHSVMEDSHRRRRSTLQLVVLRLRNMALQDKGPRAHDEFLRLITRLQPEAPPGTRSGCIVVPHPMTTGEWLAAAEKHNIISEARRQAEIEEEEARRAGARKDR